VNSNGRSTLTVGVPGLFKTLLILTVIALWSVNATAQVPVITVTGSNPDNSTTAVIAYRWLIEEDTTHHIVPGETCNDASSLAALADCQSVDFHTSYLPAVAKGHSGDPLPDLDPTKHYYISVLPDAVPGGALGVDSYSNGATQLAPGQVNVDVRVNKQPIPTAQIRVLIFRDDAPVNNAPDQADPDPVTGVYAVEPGLAGFDIQLEDAGGRYGIAGQIIKSDVYGNPLGTTYNPDGSVNVLGDGVLTTDANGVVVIQNLYPGKYGILATPPANDPNWYQTTSIEGQKLQDAWVKANEPSFFAEFGPPGPHVSIGFVKAQNTLPTTGGHTVDGTVRQVHSSRPPDYSFYTGPTVANCLVALNENNGGVAGAARYVAPCADNSSFSIPNVPDGSYTLSIWDEPLDVIFASQAVTVQGGDVHLLDVPVFMWFGHTVMNVFSDDNGNGQWDAGELPIQDWPTDIRWRDGTIYAAIPTDVYGGAPYDETFPFFSWLVAELGYPVMKPTGVTITVDAGGPLADGEALNPQPQFCTQGDVDDNVDNCGTDGLGAAHINPNTGNNLSRLELYDPATGPVLLEGFQNFMAQTNVMEWGIQPYKPGENGGITGVVYYDVTRAEDDPAYAGAEVWEPGIPRIQVALYVDHNNDGIIDDLDGNGTVEIADVDNWPFGNFPGSEDFDYNGNNIFDQGDALRVTHTDSWDDNKPTGCQGDPFVATDANGNSTAVDCYDGLRVFNQVRPAVFDGGYAFFNLNPDYYIVATGDHRVYETLKEEDKNVTLGDGFIAPNLLPPTCVGKTENRIGVDPTYTGHTVPGAYTLFDDGTPPLHAGTQTAVCDMKSVILADAKNAAADFFMFTQVPIAGHGVGFILDDASNEFDPNSPQKGEKYSPPFTPVSIRDWKGNEIGRTYSDRWGRFTVLVPGTYTANVPSASGVAPSMITTCMNDPGPIPDPNDPTKTITDPFYKPQYSQFCYTLQYMPGATTYLDTPVVPVAAFAGPDQFALDCNYTSGTPVIQNAYGPSAVNGPYVDNAGDILTVTSAGTVNVTNPLYDGTTNTTQTVARDYSFGGTQGHVYFNGVEVDPNTVNWAADGLSLTVPVPAGGGQMIIARADGTETQTGLYVTQGGGAYVVTTTIQAAIDAATDGDLIIVPQGTYNEMVIMDKAIRLQGSGAGTIIQAANRPANKLQDWYAHLQNNPTNFDLLPGQGVGFGFPEPTTLFTESGTGVIVLGKAPVTTGNGANAQTHSNFLDNATRVDGLTINGADNGAGIIANGYAFNLQITNNRVMNNYGIYGGGIRVGHPQLTNSAVNTGITIGHNFIASNGTTQGEGGGVSLYYGTDNYQVTNNWICGNFSGDNGGGVGHYGLSNNGVIAQNKIIFNQSFQQTSPVSGGGIFVGGVPTAAGTVTEGTGNVVINDNLIQGNNAGAGNGGGISLAMVNGTDVGSFNPNAQNGALGYAAWYGVDITNNMIVNNVTGFRGAISLQDALKVNILGNTIAHNDSTATTADAITVFNGGVTSTASSAGVATMGHSGTLATYLSGLQGAGACNTANPNAARIAYCTYGIFSNANMVDNIIFENRAFQYDLDSTAAVPTSMLTFIDFIDVAAYAVPAVAGAPTTLTTTNNLLTADPTDPVFVEPYFNQAPGVTIQQPEASTTLTATPAFDEGGNYITVRYGPLTLDAFGPAYNGGDYHLGAVLGLGVDLTGTFPLTASDFDGDSRVGVTAIDVGADQLGQ